MNTNYAQIFSEPADLLGPTLPALSDNAPLLRLLAIETALRPHYMNMPVRAHHLAPFPVRSPLQSFHARQLRDRVDRRELDDAQRQLSKEILREDSVEVGE